VTRLLKSSLQPSSIPTYRRAWKLYGNFSLHIFGHSVFRIPLSPANLALFIAYLFDKKYSPATVNTYVSAIGYLHRLADEEDPTKVNFIKEMLKGFGKLMARCDSRLPITIPILHKIFQSCTSTPEYETRLFKAMCAVAFFAFLRVGEITATKQSMEVLQLSQVTTLSTGTGSVEALKLTFLTFKHHYNSRPISLVLSRQPDVCPVKLLLEYMVLRGNSPGPLFQHPDGSPVSRTEFSAKLNFAIKACGLDPTRYKGHSFRIGAASHAAENGFTDTQIRLLGRWKSDAFKKYIRIPSLSN